MTDTPASPAAVAVAPAPVRPPTGAEILAKAAQDRAELSAILATMAAVPLRHSETLGKLALALAKAQGTMQAAARDNKNPFFKSKYSSLASVWDACRKALSDNELAIVQLPTSRDRGVVVTTLLIHSSGEWIEERLTMIAEKDTPQAVGSTITYGRRYGLSAMVGVAPEDDDGQAASDGPVAGVKWDKATGPLQQELSEPPGGSTLPAALVAESGPTETRSAGTVAAPAAQRAPRAGQVKAPVSTPAPSQAPTQAAPSGAPPPPGRPPMRAPGT